VAEALAAVLEEAARRYVADPTQPCSGGAGCLALEGARCNDPEAREAARALVAAAQDTIHRFVAATHPELAGPLTDYVTALMAGLSSMARSGHDLDRLLATARLASVGIAQALHDEAPAHPRIGSSVK